MYSLCTDQDGEDDKYDDGGDGDTNEDFNFAQVRNVGEDTHFAQSRTVKMIRTRMTTTGMVVWVR